MCGRAGKQKGRRAAAMSLLRDLRQGRLKGSREGCLFTESEIISTTHKALQMNELPVSPRRGRVGSGCNSAVKVSAPAPPRPHAGSAEDHSPGVTGLRREQPTSEGREEVRMQSCQFQELGRLNPAQSRCRATQKQAWTDTWGNTAPDAPSFKDAHVNSNLRVWV